MILKNKIAQIHEAAQKRHFCLILCYSCQTQSLILDLLVNISIDLTWLYFCCGNVYSLQTLAFFYLAK